MRVYSTDNGWGLFKDESGIKSQLKMYICGGIKMYNYSAKATQSLSL